MSTNPYEASQQESNVPAAPRPRDNSIWINAPAVLIGCVLLAFFLLPIFRFIPSRHAIHRGACSYNMRRIGVALKSYHVDYGGFPPAYTVDADGKPLHSWRTLILPYLDQKALYDTIDLSKPWDDPINAKAAATRLNYYQCPSASRGEKGKNLTTYLASVGPKSAIHPTRSRKLSEMKADLSNTLILIEVPTDKAVPWMSPQDANESLIMSISGDAKLAHYKGMNIVTADGMTKFLGAKLPSEERRAMITIAGGEKVELDE